MSTTTRWTSADLESLPDDGTRYEIIDGELYMSTAPHFYHAEVCTKACFRLELWNQIEGRGKVIAGSGIIFADDDDVIPDALWISNERLAIALGDDGKLHSAPELVIEVLSPGATNEKRDHEIKLELYSRCGVSEYWILSWQNRQIEVYRRAEAELRLAVTLAETEVVESPLLPGFSCSIASLFP